MKIVKSSLVTLFLYCFLFNSIGIAKEKKAIEKEKLPDQFIFSKGLDSKQISIYKKLCELSHGTNYMSTKLSLYDPDSFTGDFTPGDMYDKKIYDDVSINIKWNEKKNACIVRGSIKGIYNGNSKSYKGYCFVHEITFSIKDDEYIVTKCYSSLDQ